MHDEPTIFSKIGGEPTFIAIVDAFYRSVETDPILRPLYPEDLADSRRHLALFLIQYFGGPRTYEAERGHPRLRLRHAHFEVGERERDAWLKHMLGAINEVGIAEPARTTLVNYMVSTADFLVNVPRQIGI